MDLKTNSMLNMSCIDSGHIFAPRIFSRAFATATDQVLRVYHIYATPQTTHRKQVPNIQIRNSSG